MYQLTSGTHGQYSSAYIPGSHWFSRTSLAILVAAPHRAFMNCIMNCSIYSLVAVRHNYGLTHRFIIIAFCITSSLWLCESDNHPFLSDHFYHIRYDQLFGKLVSVFELLQQIVHSSAVTSSAR